MSDSKLPGKPGQPDGRALPSRPDLFATRAVTGQPPRREDTVRILSTMKPAAGASGTKNARPLWISSMAAVCAIAVAAWYTSHSEKQATNHDTLLASASSTDVAKATDGAEAAALPHSATNAPSPAESQASGSAPVLLANEVATAVAMAGWRAAPETARVDTMAQASPSHAAAVPDTDSSHAGSARTTTPSPGASRSLAELSESHKSTSENTSTSKIAKTSATRAAGKAANSSIAVARAESDDRKAGLSARAKRADAERLAKARRSEASRLAQSPSPAGGVAARSSSTPYSQREADADATVIEALLPYVKRTPTKASARAASSTVSSVNGPVTAR